MAEWVQAAGVWLGYGVVWLLCLAGIVLSCIALSGTWLVALATILAAVLSGPGFPGWWTVGLFLVLCVLVEGLEALAGSWGVNRRGGSARAGLAAFAGGLLGLVVGGLIPPPLIGSLVGMFVCSFALTYWVELQRLQERAAAAHIARGALVARVLAILLKVVVSLGMSVALLVGVIVR